MSIKLNAYVISLKRRRDRLEKFLKSCPIPVTVFEAVDGSSLVPPSAWTASKGAYGCLLSHLQILDKVQETTLVLEDDAYFAEGFIDKLGDFLARVPPWDALMIGGQHIQTAPFVSPGIVRCKNVQRTHAYLVRPGEFLERLRQRWQGANTHCDHIFGAMHASHQVYAPYPFLVGQAASLSDIATGWFVDRMWSSGCTEELLVTEGRLPEYYYGDDGKLRDAVFIQADKVGKLREFILSEIAKSKIIEKRFAITGVPIDLVMASYQPCRLL